MTRAEGPRVIESKLFSSGPGLRSLQRLASIEGGPAGRTFRVATFSALMITVSGQKAAYGALSRALTSRVAPSISRNPACRFYRVKFITPVAHALAQTAPSARNEQQAERASEQANDRSSLLPSPIIAARVSARTLNTWGGYPLPGLPDGITMEISGIDLMGADRLIRGSDDGEFSQEWELLWGSCSETFG